jgi:aminoglycoside phosphotransferase (APT) family kinase protein
VILPNPEREWMRAAADPSASIDREEVERRIGPTTGALELLSGGMVNVNVRVGRDRVLRIYRGLDEADIYRRPSTVGKEAALASRGWRWLRTPRVLARGADFVLLEYVEHTPLDASHGAAVGRALAEIHATTYAATGFLADDLTLVRPDDWGPIADDKFTARDYGRMQLAGAASAFGPELAARIAAFLDTDPLAARNAVDVPVLTHSDFKVSNVHWTASGVPLVLDWELTWAGSRYIDIGQILRWHPPEPFAQDFAAAYVDGGGQLADDWRRLAETVDLCSLIGLYRHAATRTTDHLLRRIIETIDS